MSIADVVIIAVIGLCALLGLWFGTSKSLITLLAWAGSFVIALFVTRVVAYALIDIEPIKNFVFGDGFSLFSLVKDSPLAVNPPADGIAGAIFAPLLGPAAEVAASLGYAADNMVNGAVIAYTIFSAAVCLVLMFAIRLVMIILTWILKKIFRRGDKPSPVSRLGGFVFNGAKGLAFTVIFFMILAPILAFPFMGIVTTDIDDKSFVAKPVFGFFGKFSSQMVAGEKGMEDRIEEILKKSDIKFNDDADHDDEYTVTFDTTGGSDVPSQTITEGQQLEKPDDPTKEGFLFDGWYTDLADENPVEFPVPIGNDVKLYAKWAVAYTVTFDTNGGSAVDEQILKTGDPVTEPADPTKDGFIFDGWYADTGLTEPADFTALTVAEEDITLYAKWTAEPSEG